MEQANALVVVGVLVFIGGLITTIAGIFASIRATRLAAQLQPAQIKGVEAQVKQDLAETDTISIDNYGKIYQAYKGLVADMSQVLGKQLIMENTIGEQGNEIKSLNREVADLKTENTSLREQLTKSQEQTKVSEEKFIALELRTKDYPYRLVKAEAEIESLRAIIIQKDELASETSHTESINANTRKIVADTALIAAGGKPIVTSKDISGGVETPVATEEQIKEEIKTKKTKAEIAIEAVTDTQNDPEKTRKR